MTQAKGGGVTVVEQAQRRAACGGSARSGGEGGEALVPLSFAERVLLPPVAALLEVCR